MASPACSTLPTSTARHDPGTASPSSPLEHSKWLLVRFAVPFQEPNDVHVLIPVFQIKNWGTGQFSNVFKVAQLVKITETSSFQLQSLYPYLLSPPDSRSFQFQARTSSTASQSSLPQISFPSYKFLIRSEVALLKLNSKLPGKELCDSQLQEAHWHAATLSNVYQLSQ